MRDQEIACTHCGNRFLFTASEQIFYAERNLSSPPKRCKECRDSRKQQDPRSRKQPPKDFNQGLRFGRSQQPRDFNRDRHRHPSSDPHAARFRGDPSQPGAARFRGTSPEDSKFARRGSPFQAHHKKNSWGEPVDRAPSAARTVRQGHHTEERPWNRQRKHERETSSPRPAPTWKPRPQNFRPVMQREEAQSFSIRCTLCGEEGQVPFQPTKGRQVFCKPCYRSQRTR